MFKSNYFKVIMKINKVSYGKNLNLYGIPVIFRKGRSKLKIGSNCTVKSSFLSNLIGLSQRTIIVTRSNEAQILIGNEVGMSGVTIYARKSIIIGDNVLIGGNTKILDNDFHPLEVEARNKDIKEKIKAKEIIIENNCFIGCNSIILKGSKIGEGSVVGAGSVVCGEFPANSIIAGNPAKLIKKLVEVKK